MAVDFLEYPDDRALPASIALKPDQLVRVDNFERAHAVVSRGADSAQVAIDLYDQPGAWQRAVPLVPPRPFDFGKRIVIILPTYNERDNLPLIVDAIGRHLVCDVLVVDDHSPDGTGAIADELAAAHGHIHVMHRAGKMGLASAYLDGFRWALEREYDLLFEMDADFSHPPHDLPRLAHGACVADVALGSRYVPGGGTAPWTFNRRVLSGAGNFYARRWLGRSLRDWTGGFRCYRASLLRRMDLSRVRSTSFSVQVELAWYAKCLGASIVEVPFRFGDRAHGESKIRRATVVEALYRVPLMRLRRKQYGHLTA
jgi:dolichol-phosphate mannosyltransferase